MTSSCLHSTSLSLLRKAPKHSAASMYSGKTGAAGFRDERTALYSNTQKSGTIQQKRGSCHETCPFNLARDLLFA